MDVGIARITLVTVLVGCSGTSEGSGAVATEALGSSFESDLVGPLLQEVRRGVRPFDDEGLGVCRGTHACDEFLGRTVEDPLPPGEYGLFAALRVPPVGPPGTWTVKVTTTCTGEGADGTPYTREHDVVAPPGRSARPHRLVLQRITSPDPDGPRSCTWTVDAPHPDREIHFEGSWTTR